MYKYVVLCIVEIVLRKNGAGALENSWNVLLFLNLFLHQSLVELYRIYIIKLWVLFMVIEELFVLSALILCPALLLISKVSWRATQSQKHGKDLLRLVRVRPSAALLFYTAHRRYGRSLLEEAPYLRNSKVRGGECMFEDEEERIKY